MGSVQMLLVGSRGASCTVSLVVWWHSVLSYQARSPSVMGHEDIERNTAKDPSEQYSATEGDNKSGDIRPSLKDVTVVEGTLPIEISTTPINFDHPYHPTRWPAWQKWLLAAVYW